MTERTGGLGLCAREGEKPSGHSEEHEAISEAIVTPLPVITFWSKSTATADLVPRQVGRANTRATASLYTTCQAAQSVTCQLGLSPTVRYQPGSKP